ncbi:MAG: hypothetical protein M3417_16000 [Actinomycetota bacterium]|nr:hypothetical protein [Actinomycetota bacterium]
MFTVSGSAVAVIVTRDDAYLNATSRELAGTPLSIDQARGELRSDGRDVNQIRREMFIEGHEVYAIEGPRTRCILIAGVGQPAGKSESIGCQPSGETKALGSSIPLGSRKGTVDLVWTGSSAEDVAAEAGGQRLAIQSGPTVLAVTRPDPDAAGVVTWTSAGKPRSFNLISARELDPRRRATLPTATATSTP